MHLNSVSFICLLGCLLAAGFEPGFGTGVSTGDILTRFDSETGTVLKTGFGFGSGLKLVLKFGF